MTLSAFLNAILDITIPFLLLWSSRHALRTSTSIDRCVIQWLAFIAYTRIGAFIDTWFSWLPLYDASRLFWSVIFLMAQLTGGDPIYRPYIRQIFHDHSQVFDIVAEVAGALLLFVSGTLFRIAHILQKGHATVPYLRLLRFPLDIVLPWWNDKETSDEKNRFWGVILKTEEKMETIETTSSPTPLTKAPPLDSHASPLAILEAYGKSSSSPARSESRSRPHVSNSSHLIPSMHETNEPPARRLQNRTIEPKDKNSSSTRKLQTQPSKPTAARARTKNVSPQKSSKPRSRPRRKHEQEHEQEPSTSTKATEAIPTKRKSPPASTTQTVSTPKRQKLKPAQGATRSSKRIRKATFATTTKKSSSPKTRGASPSRRGTSTLTSRTRSKAP